VSSKQLSVSSLHKDVRTPCRFRPSVSNFFNLLYRTMLILKFLTVAFIVGSASASHWHAAIQRYDNKDGTKCKGNDEIGDKVEVE
jgi:hypothetical protein